MAIQKFTIEQLEAAFKVRHDKELRHLFYDECPFAAYATKRDNLAGRFSEVVCNGDSGFAASSYSVAYNNAQATDPFAFKLKPKRNYIIGMLDALALMAGKQNLAALESTFDQSIESCMEGWTRQAEFLFLNRGGGARGRIATGGISSATVTLEDPFGTRWFKPGMPIQFYPDNGTGSAGTARDSGATLTVSSVDDIAGTVTFTAAVSTISGAVVGDYLFLEDEYQDVMSSIYAWIPYLSADLGTHLEVDQTANPLVRAGSRVPVQGQSTEEGLITALAKARAYGQKINTVWLAPERYADLLKDVESKRNYSSGKMKVADLSCETIRIHGGHRGPVNVVEMPGLDSAHGLMTRDGTWELRTVGDWPHFSEAEGTKMKHLQTEDTYMYAMAGYGELACLEPRNQGWIQWDQS